MLGLAEIKQLRGNTEESMDIYREVIDQHLDDPALIQQRMAHFIDYRKQTQPPGASLGSIFKTPPGDYVMAWALPE